MLGVSSKRRLAGASWAVVAIMILSGSFLMLSLGMTTSLNAYDLTALRFGISAFVLTPATLKHWSQPNQFQRPKPIYIVMMISAFGAPYLMLLSLAMKVAPASAAGVLNPGIMAIASVLLGKVFLGNRVGFYGFTGLLLTVAGVAFFTAASGHITYGHMILGVTGIMWASYMLVVRLAGVCALTATAIVAVGSAVLYLPVYLAFLPKKILAAQLTDVLIQAGFHGVLVSVVAIYALNRSTELLGTTTGAALPALIPAATLGLSVVLLGQHTTISDVISAGLLVIGLGLIMMGRQN